MLALVAAVILIQRPTVSERLFGAPSTEPDQVQPPAGLALVAGAPEPPVATSSAGGAVDPAAVRRALDAIAMDGKLGPHAAIWVGDLGSGSIVYRHGPASVVPASTLKLLTATAALQVLGPMTRFATTARLAGNVVTLVGGGDPLLMSRPSKGQYPPRADLGTLAAQTAQALTVHGIRRVRLGYDASRFTGSPVNPSWPATYLSGNVVPPITALWADEGNGPGGRYVADPAGTAAALFASALGSHGITVRGPIRAAAAGAGSGEIARVESAPLGEILQRTLAVSDNNAAEVIAHQVGLAIGHDGSFAGGAAAVTSVLTKLGVSMAGSQLHDGSGLSREDRLSPATLLDVLELAASAQHPQLREVITGLPVAGFTGSLQWRFENGPAVAKGRVIAKTGTLTGVSGLAGIATDLDGNRMAFVAIADQVAAPDTLEARADLDRIAAALGACHCGR